MVQGQMVQGQMVQGQMVQGYNNPQVMMPGKYCDIMLLVIG